MYFNFRIWHKVLYILCVFQVYWTLAVSWTTVHSFSLYWTRLSNISVFAIARGRVRVSLSSWQQPLMSRI